MPQEKKSCELENLCSAHVYSFQVLRWFFIAQEKHLIQFYVLIDYSP